MNRSDIRSSSQIRQDFLDFFKSKQHTIVPSSSLMPDSPNLLFTNAGMNQFVPIFLGERQADVSKWAGADPSLDTRAADTQKCIRAGGKHNDLEDVGLDTYHHTFFEMLGNWSFGDYFKQEAIEWAWELITGVWKFPKERLYATVYKPGEGDPADFDQDAYDIWEKIFTAAGLDPRVHIVYGNKKDNFWMMGDTGPCGPCSELHVDLTPAGDTKGKLVNCDSAECIEIWNLVFIQFNANPDGTFAPLPAKHVDTGMGFERVTSILQCTKHFTDFTGVISNYDTDVFRPIFDEIEKLSGKKYTSTLPKKGVTPTEQENIDVAFRVLADHIRTLSFSIADGIQPGNNDRNYVLRRILRRAVRYGRTLGFHEPFFHKLVSVLVAHMGDVFPELKREEKRIESTLKKEEEDFNRTLDDGLRIFEQLLESKAAAARIDDKLKRRFELLEAAEKNPEKGLEQNALEALGDAARAMLAEAQQFDRVLLQRTVTRSDIKEMFGSARELLETLDGPERGNTGLLREIAERFRGNFVAFLNHTRSMSGRLGGSAVFLLYDTYGFPADLTELLARERGLELDHEGFNALMEEQRERARNAQKREVISLSQLDVTTPTEFVGFDHRHTLSKILDVVKIKDRTAIITDTSAFYAEMGGQLGDTGEIRDGGTIYEVVDTQKFGDTWLHFIEGDEAPAAGAVADQFVNTRRRDAIQRHHTVTHLLHWALHEVVSKEASQKGSSVGPDKLTFDFNSAALTPQQVVDVEKLVNERILENAGVSWTEVPYADVRSREDVMQFFGDKYGDVVRVVQIGGKQDGLNGYSMELCGGTHTRATGEIGLFRIVAESAIASGVRRIEAIAGFEAYRHANRELELIKSIAGKINTPVGELEKKIESMLAHQKELEKELKAAKQREAAQSAKSLIETAVTVNAVSLITKNLGDADGDTLQAVADALKGSFKGVVVLGGTNNGNVALAATVAPDLTKRIQAGKIIQHIAPIVGGKGGGRPDNARGGGKEPTKLDEALAAVKSLL